MTKKIGNINSITVHVVQEALCDILQSVFEEAFGSSAISACTSQASMLMFVSLNFQFVLSRDRE